MHTCARAAGSLIRWWTLGVSITEHSARSGLQDKNIFTGTFVSVNDEDSVMRVCVWGGGWIVCTFYILSGKILILLAM